MTALDDAPDVYAIPPATDDEARRAWTIDGAGKFAWAMRKARDLRRRQMANAAVAAAEYERIEAWIRQEDARIEPDLDFFLGHLQRYALAVRADDPDRKTLTSPYGEVSTRACQEKWSFDQQAVVAWAKERHPGIVRTKRAESVLASDLKGVLVVVDDLVVDQQSGEAIDFVTVEPPVVKAIVNLDLGDPA